MSFEELLNLLKESTCVDEIDNHREDIAQLIPKVRTMFGYDQMNKAHQYDLWMHSLHVVCSLPRNINDNMLYLTALLHDIGKPISQCEGTREGDTDMHYYGHPLKSKEIVRDDVIPSLEMGGYKLSGEGGRLVIFARYNFPKKIVMVLTVTHPFDSVEVLGIFDDKEVLRKESFSIIEKDEYLNSDIGNLHIFECPLNKMTGEFYPINYDDPNSMGTFLENQDDISAEILGEDFLKERG